MKKISFLFLLLFLFQITVVAQDGDNLFDDSFLHEIRFENADTNTYITTKDYQMLNMTFDGNQVSDVGFKRKGNISGYPTTNKFGIKIKTNKYVQGQEYDGTKEFTLHMNYQDPTMMREKLTYEICDQMGLFSLRTAFAKVYINDVYWGLFTIVEGKDEMYKQVFDNRKADAMESVDFGNMCYEGANISDYSDPLFGDFYFHDNGDYNSSWSRFITMLDKVNNTPDVQYVAEASQYLNLRDFFTYQAVNVYLLNHDSYIGFVGNQRYVYDTITNIWQVTPWDFNASFGLWDTNNSMVTDYPLFPGFSCFGDKINNIPELKNYYLDGMCDLVNTVCDTTTMYNRIDQLKNQIQQAVYDDTRKVVSNEDFDNGLEFGYHELFFENQPALKTVLRERSKLISQALIDESFMCTPTNTIDFLNEINQLKVFPNPSADVIHFDLPFVEDKFHLSISNAVGQMITNITTSDKELNISELNIGVYYVLIKSEKKIWNGMFVKN